MRIIFPVLSPGNEKVPFGPQVNVNNLCIALKQKNYDAEIVRYKSIPELISSLKKEIQNKSIIQIDGPKMNFLVGSTVSWNIVRTIHGVWWLECPQYKKMLAPYSIGKINSGPRVRAYCMYNALKEEMPTIFISGHMHRRIFPQIKQIFRRNHIDYVYIEALASFMTRFDYIFLDNLKKKGARIFPFVNDLYWKFPSTLKRSITTKIWYRYCEREMNWYLKNATALVFVSKTMDDVIDFSEKYTLLHAGDASRCLNQELPKNKNITFVGGIFPKTGVDILMRAMEIVTKEHTDACCTVVGYGDQELISPWKGKEYVSFITGTYKDLPGILSQAYILVIPWPRIPYNDLTIPLKLFDYMSFGRPIVAKNCKETANFIKENEIGVITEDNPESLAQGILKLLDNRDLAIEYGKNAILAIKNKHSWNHRAKELIRIMENAG